MRQFFHGQARKAESKTEIKTMEIKLIWDDRDANNEGWFAREYTQDGDNEWQFDAEKDADAQTLIEAAGVKQGADVEIYRSISNGLPSETVTA